MRKLCFKVLIAGLAVMGLSAAASAVSVDMNWYGLTITNNIASGNSVTIAPSSVQTLTLEISMSDVSFPNGLSAFFLSFEFDTDGGNELNFLLEYQPAVTTVGTSIFSPIGPGLEGTQFTESVTSGTKGQLGQYEAFGSHTGGGTTFVVGFLIFTTNHGNVSNDGNDIFTGADILAKGGQATVILDDANGGGIASNITSAVSFGGASVNVVPEPGALSLLAISVGVLLLTGRRGGQK